jgi:hypothetical protein
LRPILLLALVVPLAGFSSLEVLFAPRSELWPRWQAHDAAATAEIDHTPWDRLLGRYLTAVPGGVNSFAYDKVSPEDRIALDAYVAGLAGFAISGANKARQRAYWINLYNALTVQLVLSHFPVASIRDIDISPGLFGYGPWDKTLIQIEGEALSLNDIEHRILRPIWRDPRVHYGLNCASIGCPNLQPLAFTAENSEALLEAAARAYVNHPRGVEVLDGELVVSSIYAWFAEDFGTSDAQVISHLVRYAEPDLAGVLGRISEIDDHRYDWTLNGTIP